MLDLLFHTLDVGKASTLVLTVAPKESPALHLAWPYGESDAESLIVL